MNLFGWDLSWRRKSQAITLDQLMQRLEAVHETVSGIAVTPETCMQAPTVHAIVTGISRRIATLPVHVLRKTTTNGRTSKEQLPNHPVARLLNHPNEWQTRVDYWLDASSYLLRYGRYFAFKGRGNTGPIRRLIPICPAQITIKQDENWDVVLRASQPGGEREYTLREIHYARGPARDGICGDSPVNDCREAIALEIAAERFGAAFFGNGAMPFIPFKFSDGVQGFRSDEERLRFVEDFQNAYSSRGRFRAMLTPKGVEMGQPVAVENDKAQFLETRKYQRNVIAGAFGVPPYLVGDLERQTFNNAEQQSRDLIFNAILPFIRIFEASMERDLLTSDDRSSGVIIRFNLDATLRGDFASRQTGLKMQREAGVISPNEWREQEGMNPIAPEDGGDAYWQQGPSGQRGPERGEGSEPDAETGTGN